MACWQAMGAGGAGGADGVQMEVQMEPEGAEAECARPGGAGPGGTGQRSAGGVGSARTPCASSTFRTPWPCTPSPAFQAPAPPAVPPAPPAATEGHMAAAGTLTTSVLCQFLQASRGAAAEGHMAAAGSPVEPGVVRWRWQQGTGRKGRGHAHRSECGVDLHLYE